MKKTLSKIKNLIERVRYNNQLPTVAAETVDFTKEFTIRSLSNEDLSLSNRKRNYYIKHPIENKNIKNRFTKVKAKLKGYKLWSKISQEVKTLGTNSNLFDAHEAYRQNLDLIMQHKVRIVYEENEDIQKRLGLLFHPDSKFRHYWYFIIVMSVIYVITAMPILMAFYEVTTDSEIFVFETMIDTIFFIDMLITFNSAYIDPNGDFITNRAKICKNYLSGFFFLDFVAIFPFWVFADVKSTSTQSLTRMVRITKLTRIFRISKIIPIIRSVIDSKKMAPILEFMLNYQGATRLITILYSILIIAHFISCIWYFLAKINGIYPDTWVAELKVDGDSSPVLYLRGIYFAFTVMNTVGFGDIHPTQASEIAICIVIMMFGICFYSFLVGTLASILSSLDSDASRLNEKKNIIEELNERYLITNTLKTNLCKYIKQAKHGDIASFQETLNKLPNKLQYCLVMSMYNASPHFIHLFKDNDERFAVDVIPRLNVKHFANNEIVYCKKSLPFELYFVAKGRVNYVFGNKMLGIKSFPKGSYFGEVELIKNTPRSFTTASEGDSLLLTLSSKTFAYILSKYPKIAKDIYKKADVQELKDKESLNEMLDIIEVSEVSRVMPLADLAGRPQLLLKKKRSKYIPATMFYRRTIGSVYTLSKTQQRMGIFLELQELKTQVGSLNDLLNKIIL